jgi:protein-S-isoprenylcysteine O-methyltransferase Ste14
MNVFRYYLALVLTCLLGPSLLFWLIIHPFIGFWRRLGAFRAYAVVIAVVGLGAGTLFLVRKRILGIEFGTNWLLIAIGSLGIATAVVMRRRLHAHFGVAQLAGLPELEPARQPQRLVTEGLHGWIRHPRYVQYFLLILSFALIANYLALFLTVVCWVPGIYLIVLLEERELRDRFGRAYEEYCQGVPCFFPRWRRKI